MTLVLDIGKGAFVVFVTAGLSNDPVLISLAAVFSVIGHCFPISLKFKGGKGVATGIGVILALHFFAGLVMVGI